MVEREVVAVAAILAKKLVAQEGVTRRRDRG
jgi:hypothetical protein